MPKCDFNKVEVIECNFKVDSNTTNNCKNKK